MNSKKSATRLKPSKYSNYLSNSAVLKLRPSTNTSQSISNQDGFIQLSKSKRRGLQMEALPKHRQISKEESESEVSSTSESDDGVAPTETSEEVIRRRTKEFEIQLRADPGNVKSWIEYSKLHLSTSSTAAGRGSRTAKEAVAVKKTEIEVSLSILERALECLPKNRCSADLQIAYLKNLAELWSPQLVTAKWISVLEALTEQAMDVGDEGMMKIWLEYISWREGRGLGTDSEGEGEGDGVDEVVEVYGKALGSIKRMLERGDNRGEPFLGSNDSER